MLKLVRYLRQKNASRLSKKLNTTLINGIKTTALIPINGLRMYQRKQARNGKFRLQKSMIFNLILRR
jgi:hypothetical protein